MSDSIHVTGTARTGRNVHYVKLIGLLCILGLALGLVAVLYGNPANIAPADPVASGFYP